jgi:hydrogenase maturation protease
MNGGFRVKVIGIGSPHGDDGLGWRAVEHLQGGSLASLAGEDAQLELVACRHPGTALLELLGGCDLAVIIDAALADLPAGSVLRLDPEQDELPLVSNLSSHGMGVAAILDLARALQESPTWIRIFAIVGTKAAGAEGTLPDPTAVFHELARQLRQEIVSCRQMDHVPAGN